MYRRRFVNLVVQNWADGVHSVHRINPYQHLFYRSREEAEAANLERIKKEVKTLQRLPGPITSFSPSPGSPTFHGRLDMFALLGRPGKSESRIVSGNKTGDTALYDADRHLLLTLPRLHDPKRLDPVCLSITQPGADEASLYVMDRCSDVPGDAVSRGVFSLGNREVLEYRAPRFNGDAERVDESMEGWRRWRRLPVPPPFVDPPEYFGGYSGFRHWYEPPTSIISSYATMVDGQGCSTICISSDRNGTYCFDTGQFDQMFSSHHHPTERAEWRHVGDWALPFDGRAEHIPEFNLWFGFSRLRMVKHKCTRYMCTKDAIRWVL